MTLPANSGSRKAQSGCDVRARSRSHEQTLLGSEPTRDGDRLVARDVLDAVKDVEVERAGNEVRTDSLDQMRARRERLAREALRDDGRFGGFDRDGERTRELLLR